MRRESASWESMDCLDSEKRERKEDVASDELVESDRRASELSKRAWWRVERRSSMAWCFFCKSASWSRVLAGRFGSGRSSMVILRVFAFLFSFFRLQKR